MAVMDSMAIWAAAAGDRGRGLRWRDAVTARMIASARYTPYADLVVEAARELRVPGSAVTGLFESWRTMSPWPDAQAVASLETPYAFATNSSHALAELAAGRSGLRPRFVLSAEEAGWYKPDARVYRLACRRLGVPPERVLFVAGSAYDAAGARDAGLQAVFVARRADQRVPKTVPVTGSLADVVAAIDR